MRTFHVTIVYRYEFCVGTQDTYNNLAYKHLGNSKTYSEDTGVIAILPKDRSKTPALTFTTGVNF